MKKILFFMSLVLFCSCTNCGNKENKNEEEVQVDTASLVVENVISTDREQMFVNFGDDVRWFETTIVMDKEFDDSLQVGEIESITNVFQTIIEKDKNVDTKVYFITHNSDGTVVEDSVDGWWAEDFPLNDEEIKLTFEEAFTKLYEANIVKPKSKYCVIRKQVGPKAANIQYIFGNIANQVYVDAVNGNVSAKNPVFMDSFYTPLGEWP